MEAEGTTSTHSLSTFSTWGYGFGTASNGSSFIFLIKCFINVMENTMSKLSSRPLMSLQVWIPMFASQELTSPSKVYPPLNRWPTLQTWKKATLKEINVIYLKKTLENHEKDSSVGKLGLDPNVYFLFSLHKSKIQT